MQNLAVVYVLFVAFIHYCLLFLYHSHCKHNVQVYIWSMCCLYINLFVSVLIGCTLTTVCCFYKLNDRALYSVAYLRGGGQSAMPPLSADKICSPMYFSNTCLWENYKTHLASKHSKHDTMNSKWQTTLDACWKRLRALLGYHYCNTSLCNLLGS